MEKKINIAELLKDCPSGMELNCLSYDNVSFDKISADKKATYPIFCYITDEKGNRSSISFTEGGCESKRYGARCVIFPKGKTTWEGFTPPYKFKDEDKIHLWTIQDAKDGDVLVTVNDGNRPFIYKGCLDPNHPDSPVAYCGIDADGYFCSGGGKFNHWWTVEKVQPATKEQRDALMKAMTDAGYTFDFDKKELKLLISNDGDFESNNNKQKSVEWSEEDEKMRKAILTGLIDCRDAPDLGWSNFGGISIDDCIAWLEKQVYPKFKVGDRIKHRIVKTNNIYRIVNIKDLHYELRKNNETHAYYISFVTQDEWELVPDKFDVTTLKPYDKVLARCSSLEKWRIQFFEKFDKTCKFPFICMGYNKYTQCIPYEGNEHLLGTADSCSDYYLI